MVGRSICRRYVCQRVSCSLPSTLRSPPMLLLVDGIFKIGSNKEGQQRTLLPTRIINCYLQRTSQSETTNFRIQFRLFYVLVIFFCRIFHIETRYINNMDCFVLLCIPTNTSSSFLILHSSVFQKIFFFNFGASSYLSIGSYGIIMLNVIIIFLKKYIVFIYRG